MAIPPPRVILITGASSGIGRACAGYLAAKGYRVYGASRRAAPSPDAIAMDVTDSASVRDGIDGIIRREGRLDVVVNNAGIAIAGALEDSSIEEARAQFETNFFGVFRVCRAVLPVMRGQRSGYIVNMSSIGGLVAIPFQGLYSASKFAVEGMTESLRMEVRPFGIRVVLIEPGDHRTDLTGNRRVSQTSSAYGLRSGNALARMALDERNGPAPEGVARLLHRILTTPNPRLRYTTGPALERAALAAKRLLPYGALEAALRAYYQLK